MEQGKLERNQGTAILEWSLGLQIRTVFAAWQDRKKKTPSFHTLPWRAHMPGSVISPLCDSDETKSRIFNAVPDSQCNEYGDKWVRVWRRAIKMIEEPTGVTYDEGIEELNLASWWLSQDMIDTIDIRRGQMFWNRLRLRDKDKREWRLGKEPWVTGQKTWRSQNAVKFFC